MINKDKNSIDNNSRNHSNSESTSLVENLTGTQTVLFSSNVVKESEKESCWSWVVLIVSLFGCTVVGCSYSLFSLLYPDFINDFETDAATAGWIGSIHAGCGNILAVFLGTAVEKYGCRLVCIAGTIMASLGYFLSFFANHIVSIYFSYGFLAGMGIGTMALTCMIAPMHYFHKRRAFAGAVVTGGYSIGTIITGVFMRYFYEDTTWRSVCVLCACFILQMVVLAAFAFRPPNLPTKHTNQNGSDTRLIDGRNKGLPSEYIRLLCEPSVLTFLTANFFLHLGMITFFQHTPNRAINLGITPVEIAIWPVATAIANGSAKIIGGIIANLPSVERLLFYSGSLFCAGLTQTLMPLCNDFQSIIIQGVVENIFLGCAICVLTTTLVDLKGIENVAKTQALLFLFTGSGVLISTPFAGFLFDALKNYDVTFILTGLLIICGSFLSMLSYYFKRRNQRISIEENFK